jgi:SAM-dependent methyltransferase
VNPRGSVDRDVADAYSVTAASWRDGPARIYRRLADALVEGIPLPIAGADVVDIGAGTGVAGDAALAAGAGSAVAVDAAIGMLVIDAGRRSPAVAADATKLPFPDGTFDVALAAFCLNHLAEPSAGLREAARVVRSGGAVVASAYASDDDHPVKALAERALRDHGWAPAAWHDDVKRGRAPLLSTDDGCRAALGSAGLDGEVRNVRVAYPDLDTEDLVAWRLGMAQHAPFVAALDEATRRTIVDRLVAELGPRCPTLERSMMVVTARR